MVYIQKILSKLNDVVGNNSIRHLSIVSDYEDKKTTIEFLMNEKTKMSFVFYYNDGEFNFDINKKFIETVTSYKGNYKLECECYNGKTEITSYFQYDIGKRGIDLVIYNSEFKEKYSLFLDGKVIEGNDIIELLNMEKLLTKHNAI